MSQIQLILYYVSLSIASILFIHDSVLLFIRGKNNRARRTLGFTTMAWGIMYVIILIASLHGVMTFPIFSSMGLISSHFFICTMFLFPLEVMHPRWLNIKKVLIMLTPITIITIVYAIGLKLTGQEIEDFMTYQEIMESITQFNVWYRFIIFCCNLSFIYILFKFLYKDELQYIKWENENFSDLDSVDISWMQYYKHMMTAIILCYIAVAFCGSVWTIIIHTIVVTISFSILFYKGLFYENSYPEDFSTGSENPKVNALRTEELILNLKRENILNENSFEAKLPNYVEKLKNWMEQEKPYLYKDFKLGDTTRILPLNRSYLSRVFNEGFNQNFSEVVRMYRIEYAKEILTNHPELQIYKVAELCGFASDSTFTKAFQKVTGITPKQFKIQL